MFWKWNTITAAGGDTKIESVCACVCVYDEVLFALSALSTSSPPIHYDCLLQPVISNRGHMCVVTPLF